MGLRKRRNPAEVKLLKLAIPAVLFTLAAMAQPVAPRLAVSLNGAQDSTQYQGWPVLVRVTLRHPSTDATAAPVLLAPPLGTWLDALTLEVRDGTGAAQSWPLAPAAKPSDASLTLQPRTKVEPFFTLAPADTS